MKPLPTKTFVLDIGRRCNLACAFCYYHHLGNLRLQGWKNLDSLYIEIRNGISRGNDRVEITGGEPSLHPYLGKIVSYLKRNNIKCCIITNGVMQDERVRELIDSGVDEFLISRHGTIPVHDSVTGQAGALARQNRTIEIIRDAMGQGKVTNGFRFNFVLNRHNQMDVLFVAQEIRDYKPTMINFINMNPHHEWANSTKTSQIIADLRIVEPLLNEAIDMLEAANIAVNVRYYPMCRIAERYRYCICNDLHVMFDQKEWDYAVVPKTFDRYKRWGIDTSTDVEEKKEPCCSCDLQWICGGANKHWHKASINAYGELLVAQSIPGIDTADFYHYRKNAGQLVNQFSEQ